MYPNFNLCISSLDSEYSYIIFIWDMKQTEVGEGCNFEVITFDYISIFFSEQFKNVSKMCSTKYDFNIPDLLCPKPLIITGVSTSPLSANI